MPSRQISTQIIEQIIEEKTTLTHALRSNTFFNEAGNDKALIQEICYGTFRWYIQLEYILEKLLEKKIKKKDRRLKYLIIVGLYQLRYMRIPSHAVVSETVNTCKKIKKEWAKGLVNAVLRRYLREEEQLNSDNSEDVCFKTSHPAWLIDQLKIDWLEHYQSILTANNQHPPMYLRVNQRHQNRDEYLARINAVGIQGQATPYSRNGILLEQAIDVKQLPGFDEGDISVQELAAQLSVDLLDLKPEHNVLDACAAPGGKTAHILESEPNINSLTALEKDPKRSTRLQETLNRLKLSADTIVADAIDINSWWDKNHFDRILLDAPCSATGVIRRHPDIKQLRTPDEVNAISLLQLQILQALWQTLKPGGLLVYVTCSILKQENSDLINGFIEDNEDCILKPITAAWGNDTGHGRQILTGQDNMDGFFYACLEKR